MGHPPFLFRGCRRRFLHYFLFFETLNDSSQPASNRFFDQVFVAAEILLAGARRHCGLARLRNGIAVVGAPDELADLSVPGVGERTADGDRRGIEDRGNGGDERQVAVEVEALP